MPGETITPFTTLEVQPGPLRTYLDYWPQFAEARGLIDPTDIKKTRDLGSYVTRLTHHVIREADPYSVALMPDMITDSPQEQTLSNGVAEWMRTLGPFNHLGNAQDDLLRGASLLLQENFGGKKPAIFELPSTPSTEIYIRFLSLFANNSKSSPLEKQKPSENLLLAAQLIHTSAWVEPDPKRQNVLLNSAESMYEKIHDAPEAVWSDRLLAGQYRADIRFYKLSQQLQRAVRYQDQPELDRIKDVAIGYLQDQITDLQQAGRLFQQAGSLMPAGGRVRKEWAGFMLESFAMIAMRDLLFVGSKPSLTARYEIRRSFPHEDTPRTLRLKPKQSFDIVVSRRDIQGTIAAATPMQFKLYSQGNSPRGGSKEDFVDEIEYISVTNLRPEQMVEATDDLVVAYAEREILRGIGPLTILQGRFNDVVGSRLTVARR